MQEPEAYAAQSDQLIALTMGQLQDLISRAVQEGIDPLEARLEALERSLECGKGGEALQDGQDSWISTWQIVQAIQTEIVALKNELEALQETTARERAYDRQRIARLERADPQPLQRDRGEILRALIAANGGKMLAKDARKKMHLSESRFSELLTTMKDKIEVKPFHLKKSQNVILLI
jgi:uncharacterized membrane protein